ncbi:MAG TPA: alcohol dehydrogenase catalytic domain-containing protein [Acidimicrobiales bacterium]|nr:alcohol dehydrogenase catalytic domain-containing protein [Acidimicrobiales bacterium]
MRALLFGVAPEPVQAPPAATAALATAPPAGALATGAPNALLEALARTPMALRDVEEPGPLAPDWVVAETLMTGICGSDAKQVFAGAEPGDAGDNCMTAFISFPQVLGHEVVGRVCELGPAARGLDVGQRVVLNPWLSCGPRGVDPPCPACAAGDLSLCWSFLDGRLSPGIHTGNATEATGGFAERFPAHDSMLFPVPDQVPDEVAVLADPFSVSLHAVTRNPPPPGGRAVVYGAGALGITTTAILRALYPEVEVLTVARWPAQAELAAKLGAVVAEPEPRLALVETIASWSGGVLRTPWAGLPVTHPGKVDVVYDTVASAETFEVDIRVLASRGTLVHTGVSTPLRFEWSPLYFKEIRWVGSNAFGVEEVEGRRQHAIRHYLDLVVEGRVDVSPMLTHTFPLERWRSAFTALAEQDRSGAIKVAFDLRS